MAQPALKVVDMPPVDKDKSKAIDAALAQIERAFGKGSIMRLGKNDKVQEVDTVSTGSLGLDIAHYWVRCRHRHPRGAGLSTRAQRPGASESRPEEKCSPRHPGHCCDSADGSPNSAVTSSIVEAHRRPRRRRRAPARPIRPRYTSRV